MRKNKIIFLITLIISIFMLTSCMTNIEEPNNSKYIYENGKVFLLAQEEAIAVEIETEEDFQFERVSDNFTLNKNSKIAISKIDGFNKQDKLVELDSKEELSKIINIRYIRESDINPSKSKAVDVQDGITLNGPEAVLKGINFELEIEFSRVQIPENAQTLEIVLDIPNEINVVNFKGDYNNIKFIREENTTILLGIKEKLEPITINLKTENSGIYEMNVLKATYSDMYGKTEIVTDFYGKSIEVIDGVLGDFDNNGLINLNDFLAFSKAYGTSSSDSDFDNVYDIGPANLDLNYNEALYSASPDGKIDVIDFAVFIRNFGKSLGIPLSLNLPEGFEVFPVSYNPQEDGNHYIQMEIYTINDYVEPQEYLKTEIFFDDYIYNNDDKLGEFILTKDANQDEIGLTKYSAILKVPNNYSDYDLSNFLVRYIRIDGTKSVIPGDFFGSTAAYKVYNLGRGINEKPNFRKYAYVVKYWEDMTPKNRTGSVAINVTETPWVEKVLLNKSIYTKIDFSTWYTVFYSKKHIIDNRNISFEYFDLYLSDDFRINETYEIYEWIEKKISGPFTQQKNISFGEENKLTPMPKYRIKYTISDTTNFASDVNNDVIEKTVFLGESSWDYFKTFNYEYEKFLDYAEANDEFFAVEENNNNLDYGYDFDLDGIRDIYFGEYYMGILDDARGYVVQEDFNNVYFYDLNKEQSYANIRNDNFGTRVLLFNTGEKYIKLQVLGETTIDATFVNNVMNWGDSQ